MLGRTLNGASVPLAGLGAGSSSSASGGQVLGSGITCLGGCGVPSSLLSSAPSSSKGDSSMPDVSDAGEAGGGRTLGGGAPKGDGFKRLGLAAEAPKKGDDYWSSLGGGNSMRK